MAVTERGSTDYSRRLFTVRMVRPEEIVRTQTHLLRVLEEDLGVGYVPEWHYDLDDIQGVYIDHPRQALFVAVDDESDAIVGTTAVRALPPKSPPHPKWLAERYNSPRTAQLLRMYVAREHRRRGIARVLVDAAAQFIADEGSYDVIYLHTDASVAGAESFWRSMPTTEIYDGRGRGEGSEALHFELAMPNRGAPPVTTWANAGL